MERTAAGQHARVGHLAVEAGVFDADADQRTQLVPERVVQDFPARTGLLHAALKTPHCQ